jgi:autoinducer 2-degrading protein
MIAMLVKVRIKPEERQRFLEAIEVDALGSEGDEPGCLRFNVLHDASDENVYYFYEVYKDEAALEEHRKMPHYSTWRAAPRLRWMAPRRPHAARRCFPRSAPTGARSRGTAGNRRPVPMAERTLPLGTTSHSLELRSGLHPAMGF